MLQQFLNRILNAGITETTRSSLATNLRATSVVNLLLCAIIACLTLLFAFTAPSIIPLMAISMILIATSISIQFLGFNVAARIITSCFICLMALTIHQLIANQIGAVLPFTFAACALLCLSPFYLFSVSELFYAAVAFIINAAALLSAPQTLRFFNSSSDLTNLANPLIQIMLLVLSLLMLCGSTIALQFINRKEALKAKSLIQKSELENKLAMQRQEELNRLLGELQRAQDEEKKRIWANMGLADVAKILREEATLQHISDRIISYLVKYTSCNQGALFKVTKDESGEFLTLQSCYAYDRKKFIDKRISVGEGLLGECYFDKNYIYITELPNGYTHITSGLGEATPRSLLIIPVKNNDAVTGMLEFASFNEIEKYIIDFLMEAGEAIATILSTLESNERTRQLLAETQQMTEQMRAQEEEMRQNMEELAATQEQQQRIENELRTALSEKEKQVETLQSKLQLLRNQQPHSL